MNHGIPNPVTSRLGVIGGSSLSQSKGFETSEVQEMETPYGPSSGPLELGAHVVFLARHGPDRQIPPHRVNHRANLWALRKARVSGVVGTSSVGSLKEEIPPGTLVVPDDYFAPWAIPTYHDDAVVHITPALDAALRRRLVEVAQGQEATVRDGGVYVQTRGPRLETKAEIRFLREFGDIVGMTVAAEATLAQELDLPYASLCTVDNYCHGIRDEPLSYADIRRVQDRNAKVLRGVLQVLVEGVG